MNVLAHDPFIPEAPLDIRLTDLDTLLATSDFVVTLAPTTSDTAGMLDARRLGLMKRSAYLITASGITIASQDALVDVLRGNHIAGAAIDVFETHPIAPDSPFLALDNVVFTPHIGGATEETIARHSRMMANDIQRFLSGQKPLHLVNQNAWQHDD